MDKLTSSDFAVQMFNGWQIPIGRFITLLGYNASSGARVVVHLPDLDESLRDCPAWSLVAFIGHPFLLADVLNCILLGSSKEPPRARPHPPLQHRFKSRHLQDLQVSITLRSGEIYQHLLSHQQTIVIQNLTRSIVQEHNPSNGYLIPPRSTSVVNVDCTIDSRGSLQLYLL